MAVLGQVEGALGRADGGARLVAHDAVEAAGIEARGPPAAAAVPRARRAPAACRPRRPGCSQRRPAGDAVCEVADGQCVGRRRCCSEDGAEIPGDQEGRPSRTGGQHQLQRQARGAALPGPRDRPHAGGQPLRQRLRATRRRPGVVELGRQGDLEAPAARRPTSRTCADSWPSRPARRRPCPRCRAGRPCRSRRRARRRRGNELRVPGGAGPGADERCQARLRPPAACAAPRSAPAPEARRGARRRRPAWPASGRRCASPSPCRRRSRRPRWRAGRGGRRRRRTRWRRAGHAWRSQRAGRSRRAAGVTRSDDIGAGRLAVLGLAGGASSDDIGVGHEVGSGALEHQREMPRACAAGHSRSKKACASARRRRLGAHDRGRAQPAAKPTAAATIQRPPRSPISHSTSAALSCLAGVGAFGRRLPSSGPLPRR